MDGVKFFIENLFNVMCAYFFMRAKRHIEAIEARKKFWIRGRFQALFREHHSERVLLESCESYQTIFSTLNKENVNDYLSLGS